MKAPELEDSQFPEDHVRGEALRPSRRDLAPPPQEVSHAFPDVVIDRPIPHEPTTIAEVVRPSAHHAVEILLHLVPRPLVARSEDLSDAPLDPLHRLLGWRSPQVPMPILPVPQRPEGVAQKVERLAPPIAHPGLRLIERQTHLGEPPATLREHLRSPIPTQ